MEWNEIPKIGDTVLMKTGRGEFYIEVTKVLKHKSGQWFVGYGAPCTVDFECFDGTIITDHSTDYVSMAMVDQGSRWLTAPSLVFFDSEDGSIV